MQPMQPMQPMQQQQPQKKGMSGCAIAAIIAGALFLIGGLVVVGVVVFVVHKASEVVGDLQASVKEAQNAPGAEDLRAAGCKQAMVMDMDKVAKQALKDIPGTSGVQIDAGGGIFVQCQVEAGKDFTCAKVAKVFLSSPGHAVGPFTASVADMQGQESCARDYDGYGKELGAATRHANVNGAGQ